MSFLPSHCGQQKPPRGLSTAKNINSHCIIPIITYINITFGYMEDRRRIIVPYKRLLGNTDKPFSIIRRQYFLDN